MKPAKQDQQKFQPAQHRVIPMFSTPFLRGKLRFPSSMVMRDINNLVDKVEYKDNKNKLCNYTSYFDNDIREETHKLVWFRDFSNIMKDTYIEFLKTQFNRDVRQYCRDDIHLFAWVNRYDSEHQHEIHNHVDSHVSGTYYVNDTDRPIKFWNPNMAAVYGHNGIEDLRVEDDKPDMTFTGCTGFQSDMQFYPRAGDFLLWPSYLMHAVPPSLESQSKDLRYSISFNLKLREQFNSNHTGDNMSYSHVFERG
jgi:uncharacterized protein (TIGR02466 family)